MIKISETTQLSGMSERIIFFGNERLVSGLESTDAPILKGLIEQGYHVVGVISHHSESKSRTQRPLEVAEIARQHGIPLYLPNKPSEIIDEIRALNPTIAVLVAYGRIITQSVIDLFPQGIINIHPSLLPKYRGPTPIESAILNGDTETGVSIMQLSAGMDDGPVYDQRRLALGNDSKQELYEKIVAVSTDLFFAVFPTILDGTLLPQEQDSTKATYSKLIQKDDGRIDWKQPAIQIERAIRAYHSWPQSRTTLGSLEVIITKAHVIKESEHTSPGKVTVDNNRLIVETGADSLEIDFLKPLGKKEMPASAFLSGYMSQLGN